MARTIELTTPPDLTDSLLRRIEPLDGIISVHLNRGASVQPSGDVLTIVCINDAFLRIANLASDQRISALTNVPGSVYSAAHHAALARDSNESTWEEIESSIARESNMTRNNMVLMACAGSIAAIGTLTDAIHVVIGAMVIAPGFEPVTRIALGVVTRGRAWRDGLVDTLRGYAAIIAAAWLTALILQLFGLGGLLGSAAYLPQRSLLNYWLYPTVPSIMASIVAGAAGGVVLATNRSVLTAGVMIALALIPAAAATGLSLAAMEWDSALRAAVRWLAEVAIVFLTSAAVFLYKRAFVHRRAMLP